MHKINYESLKLKRQEKRFTQVDMAKLFNVNINTYVMWERGANNPNELNRQQVLDFINEK